MKSFEAPPRSHGQVEQELPPAARLTDSALATSPNSYGRPDLPQPALPTPTVVVDAPELVVAIENVDAAINQIAQTTLRNIVEQHSQDEVLARNVGHQRQHPRNPGHHHGGVGRGGNLVAAAPLGTR